jgi:hypothetical protein
MLWHEQRCRAAAPRWQSTSGAAATTTWQCDARAACEQGIDLMGRPNMSIALFLFYRNIQTILNLIPSKDNLPVL